MRRLSIAAAALVLVAAGCGGDDDEPQGDAARGSGGRTETAPAGDDSSSGSAGGAVVNMNDQLSFEPKKIEVSVGDKVTWVNIGKIGHTVTADKSKAADPSLVSIPAGTKEWDSGFVNEKESFSWAFDKPGTYRYICIPHEGAGMVGTVVVK